MRRFLRDARGSALVEIALSIPILMTLLTGIVETGFFLMLNQKLQHTAVAISDLTTRDEDIAQATLDDIFSAAPQIMAPFAMGDRARVIVSSVGQEEGQQPRILWQRSGAGTLTQASELGLEGAIPTLPGEITMRDNETLVVTEIFYTYQPFIFQVIDPVLMRRVSYFRPRIGTLTTIQ
jgi:hypothetical protein